MLALSAIGFILLCLALYLRGLRASKPSRAKAIA